MIRPSRIPVPLLLGIGTVLALLPWLWFGFHYHNIGWDATKAWMITAHPKEAFWEFSWLSSMAGGLWMSVTGYSLIALRVGYLPVMVGIVFLAYVSLRLYYDPRVAALAVIPAVLIFNSGFEELIPDYYTVPPLFGLAAMYFHLRSYRDEREERLWAYSLATGLFFAATVQTRIPAIVLGLVFALTAAIEYRYDRNAGKAAKRLAGITAGFVAGTAAIAGLLALFGRLDYAVDGLIRTYTDVSSYHGKDNIHQPLRLFTDTLIRYAKMLGIGGIALAGSRVWRRFVPGREPRRNDPLTWLLLTVVAGGTATFVRFGLGMFPPSFGILAVLFLALLMQLKRLGISRDRLILYTVGAGYMLMMNLGSSNPCVGSLKYTGLLFVPITLLESRKLVSSHVSFKLLRWVLYANVFGLFISSRLLSPHSVWENDTQYRTPALHCVYNRSDEVEELEGMLAVMHRAGLRPGDTLLCYVDIPMIHFVTRTIPALRNPWISDRFVGLPSFERTRDILEHAVETGTLPSFVVRAHCLYNPTELNTEKLRYLDSLWGAERYDTIYNRGRFVVMKRPG